MVHENNREIFLVRPIKYFISQASYNLPIRSYEEIFQEQKSHSWKNVLRLMIAHFPVLWTIFMPTLAQINMESKEFQRLGVTLGSLYGKLLCSKI